MNTFIIILTVLNSIVILYMLWLHRLSIRSETIYGSPKTVGIGFWLRSRKNSGRTRIFYIPIRNAKKLELRLEIKRLKSIDSQQMRQTLRAKFSWIKTSEDAKVFQKEYGCLDAEYVQGLVDKL